MVLAGAIVAVKANHNSQALLILVPLLVVNLVWFGLTKIINLTSSDIEGFDQLLISLTVGISVLWLLGRWLGNRNRFITFLLALFVMSVVGFVGITSNFGFVLSQKTLSFGILIIVMAFSMLLGIVLTGWRCRKNFRPVSFMFWLAVWTVAASLVSILVVCSIAFIVQGAPVSIFTVLFIILLQGLILGIFLYAVLLPYMILALRSSFYRQRFYACLRLKSMSVETKAELNQPLPGV